MGDLNARVGVIEHSTSPHTVGPFATDLLNSNGERLIEFCLINNLVISNTFFQHKSIHQKSWMHPGSKQWHTLDYTLVNQKFKSSVEDVRFYRKAAGVIGTDHHLMRTKIRLHLKVRKKLNLQKEFCVDRSKLKEDYKVLAFQNDLAKNLQIIKNDNTDINLKYNWFVNTIKEAATTHFKPDNKNKRGCKDWLTEEIIEVAEKKGDAYLKWLKYRGTSSEKKYKDKYVALRKIVKTKVEQRQVEHWDGLSEEIELAIKQHDSTTTRRKTTHRTCTDLE
jgi:ribosomal protein S7